jgi:hypothetical protein
MAPKLGNMREKVITVRDDFPPGFYEALGSFAVAFGRVEYEIKLAVKSLSGSGFHAGMVQAESSRHFHALCTMARKLATKRLSEPQLLEFTSLIDKAVELASERNDNLHAFWTAESEIAAKRIRPYWIRSESRVDWGRNRSVKVEELKSDADTLTKLYRAIHAARNKWPAN